MVGVDGTASALLSDEDSDEELLLNQPVRAVLAGSRRRRRLLAAHLRRLAKKVRRQQSPKRQWMRLDWRRWTRSFLTEPEFVKYYKLDNPNFDRVLARLRPHMEKARPTSDEEVSYELEFACTLRWLAGGNYLDIMYHHGISEASFWRGIHAVIYALLIEYAEEMLGEAKFSDPAKLEEIEKTFGCKHFGALRGCVGAIDGMAVKIQRPAASECDNPMSYYSRKGFFSVVLQAICDGNCRFLWGSLLCAGSTHDSTAWTVTELYRLIQEGEMPFKYWLNGDDAYPGDDQMMTPFPGSHAFQGAEDNFNFFQSSLRIRIEMAFGRLVNRFGILWRPLKCKLELVAPLVMACMILHNLCFDNAGQHAHDDIKNVTAFDAASSQLASVPDGLVATDINPHLQSDCYMRDAANRTAAAKARAITRKNQKSDESRKQMLKTHLAKNFPDLKRPDRD